MSLDGTGRNEPYSAFSRSPSSVDTGWWTVTRYVPVGNVPSTINAERELTTEGCTWRRPSMVVPMDMRSATVWFPSRISCMRSACDPGRAWGLKSYFLEIVRDQCLGVLAASARLFENSRLLRNGSA
ncbi:Urease [Alternaria alternata]|nr:Urease [Alternaria alternata]